MSTSKVVSLNELASAFDEVIKEYAVELRSDIEEALDLGIDYLGQELTNVAPVLTGRFKKSFVIKRQYSGVRYIGNSATAGNTSIPLINLLEYGEKSNHKGKIQGTFNLAKERIYQIMVERLKK